MTALGFSVFALPIPQGSKNLWRGQMIDVKRDELRKWRRAVKEAALDAAHYTKWIQLDEPVAVEYVFYLPDPAKSKFPDFPATKPDLDKLCRSTGDALTEAGVIRDDCRIVTIDAKKRWASSNGGAPGALITVYPEREMQR